MKKLKSHFWYNKSQRNGVFFLLFFILILQGVYFFVDFSSSEETNLPSEEIILFQNQIDSLKLIEIENRKPKIYPFNPSFITDYKGYQLGMTTQEIDRLLSHRESGKYINSARQFQVVTKVSDSLLAVISPYFKFPDWISRKKNTSLNYNKPKEEEIFTGEKQDLNIVTAIQLKEIKGIGDKLSERIIKYRTSMKGFMNDEQLEQVYGLKPEVIAKVLQRYTVLSQPTIEKVNVNTATFKEVLHLPYIDYELTKKIFQYRDEVAEIQNLEELKNIEDFPIENFDKIALYLKAE
ncbi:MAG: DNA uptake protein ComE-like DNA-binding protein [Urechidicola sp.]|jgi:DNA uptake protein ComE-like DNA-binding protein